MPVQIVLKGEHKGALGHIRRVFECFIPSSSQFETTDVAEIEHVTVEVELAANSSLQSFDVRRIRPSE